MSKTRQERQEGRLDAALKEMPASLQMVINYGATDYSKMFELMVEVAEAEKNGCAKTATQLCRTFGLDTEKRTEEPAFLIAAMVLAFDKWPVASSCPNVRRLSEIIEKGRAQTVPAGRESYLLDLISVLLAMRKAYAEPMPEGFKVDKRVDLTMLEWTLDEEDPKDPSKKKKEKRPAQLSGKIVDSAILHLITALEPLTERQKITLGDTLWNELVSEISVLNGHSLSRAVARVFSSDSRVWQDACKEERSSGRRAPAAKTSRPEEEDEEVTPGVKRPKGGGKGRGSPTPNRRRGEAPVCPEWEKTGTCDAREEGKCGKRHNHAWTNLGRVAAEKKAKK